MKFSLLEMTQSILASLSSDEVNSIGDTTESLQIVSIIEQVYYNMAARGNLPDHNGLIQLQGFDDPLKPVIMIVPDNVNRIEWIEYYDANPADSTTFMQDQFGAFSNKHATNVDLSFNGTFQGSFPFTATSTTTITVGLGTQVFTVANGNTILPGTLCEILSGTTPYMSGTVIAYVQGSTQASLTIDVTAVSGSGTFSSWVINQLNAPTTAPGYKRIGILPVHEFIKRQSSLDPTRANVGQFNFIFNGQNFLFNYQNNTQPRFCCIINNQYMIFDNYNLNFDSTLQGAKTMCWAWFIPPFILEDNFIPNLNDYQFPLLIAEAKSLAFLELKQMLHQKAEQETKRQWSNLQKNKSVTNKPSYFHQLPDYGRRLYTGGYSTGFPYDFTQGYNGAPW
jgi:hypothetical protein